MAPEGMITRPTTDRIKETLFNIIAFDIPQCQFLDLFSGSGAIGIECLSRGAKKVVFVEKDEKAFRCIEENLKKTSLKEDAIVYNMDVRTAIEKLGNQKQQFDIIFLDPPYKLDFIEDVLRDIMAQNLLASEGYIILEHGTEYILPPFRGLKTIKEKKYKTTTLRFLKGQI